MSRALTARHAVFLAAAAYVLLPGHPDAFFSGIPLGLAPLVVVATGVFVWSFFRSAADSSIGWGRATTVLVILCAMKTAAAFAAPPVGWIARYYPNDRFEGRYRRSTDFLHLDATRIDRAIDFKDDELPVYFLNEADFNRDIRREVTFPVTVAWTGYVSPSARVEVPITIQARGRATLSVDGREIVALDGPPGQPPAPRSATVDLSAGEHRIDVTYLKPANTDPLIALRGLDGDSSDALLQVTPWHVGSARRQAFRAAAIAGGIADALATAVFGFVIWTLAGSARSSSTWRFVPVRALAVGMFALFVLQGVQAALPHVHRAVSLSGGDDWLAFEARAREILTGGLLMRFNQPLGRGEVFYYYPGYSYFLAAVQRLTGEDLSGPIVVNFVALFLANILAYRISLALVGRTAALAAAAGLVLIEQTAFVRHYTYMLLSENLYFLTVSATILGLVDYVQRGHRSSLAWAGVAAGISAVTRPAMMLYLIPALIALVAADLRRGDSGRRIAAATATFVAAWFGVVLLVTLRNVLVAGTPTLISESPAHSFILYNLPPTGDADRYMKMHTGGIISSAAVLFRIALDHPVEFFSGITTKIGFSFGMIQWMGGHFHPELVLASALYLAAVVTNRASRAPVAWPVHAFIAAHLAAMVLTMPSNYGYRLILPMYLFFPMFGARLLVDILAWARGSTRTSQAPAALVRGPS